MSAPVNELAIETYHLVIGYLMADVWDRMDDGPEREAIIDYLAEAANNVEPNYSKCSYYQGVGPCSFQCHDEPICKTGEPAGGWPTTVEIRVVGTDDPEDAA